MLVLAGKYWMAHLPNREELGPRRSALRVEPVELDPGAFAPLQLAGAWALTSPDPRFGGFSGLALDRGQLLALTDNGAVAWFPKPAEADSAVQMREVPAGPAESYYRWNRDTEALTPDASRRGWWVAYEHANELWLYDQDFTRALKRVELGRRRWPPNLGVEGMAPAGRDLLLFLEQEPRIFGVHGSVSMGFPVAGKRTSFSEALRLPDGRLVAIERHLSLFGFRNALVVLNEDRASFRIARRFRLAVGSLDNIEGMTAERLPDGKIRVWLISDDNFQRPLRTLLAAIDLPVADRGH